MNNEKHPHLPPMNAGKSLKLALAQRSISQVAFAKTLGMTQPSISGLANSPRWTGASLEKIAHALDLKVSEFVALGEA